MLAIFGFGAGAAAGLAAGVTAGAAAGLTVGATAVTAGTALVAGACRCCSNSGQSHRDDAPYGNRNENRRNAGAEF